MQHLAEVMKILEGSVRRNPQMSIRYAELLASKLRSEGMARQADQILKLTASHSGALLDSSAVATSKLPTDDDSRLSTVDVSYPAANPDLVLPTSVLDQLREFQESIERFDEWSEKGISAPNRLLLYGPPGTGKTSIARQIASDLSLPLITTRSDTLVSSLLGQTSKNIRQVFDFAATIPCVLFLDEFDALGKNRADAREIGELQRVVIALLQNMDALSSRAILIAASNHPELLDVAVWRRFERAIRVDLPSPGLRKQLWARYLRTISVSSREVEKLSELSDGMSASDIESSALAASRDHAVAGLNQLSLPLAARRVARFLWQNSSVPFADENEEMSALRAWEPTIFTLRALSDLFSVSVRQVSNATRKRDEDAGSGPDSLTSV